jgi:chemotaxis protein MotB
MNASRLAVLCLAFALSAPGCVKKGIHEGVLAELAQRNTDYDTLSGQYSDALGTISDMEGTLGVCQNDLASRESTLEMTQAELAECRTQLEDARANLEASGQTARRLAERLEELSAIEAELRSRDEIFTDIVSAFEELILNGFVEVAIERGRLVIKMPQDILFESGSADIGEEGQLALAEVAGVLGLLTEREFQVEGHTDNVPIDTRRFPSNWELSSARALAVVHLFEQNGVAQSNVSAAGFSEFRPRAGNEDSEDRALNRRIEIVMVPDLEAIFGEITPQ